MSRGTAINKDLEKFESPIDDTLRQAIQMMNAKDRNKNEITRYLKNGIMDDLTERLKKGSTYVSTDKDSKKKIEDLYVIPKNCPDNKSNTDCSYMDYLVKKKGTIVENAEKHHEKLLDSISNDKAPKVIKDIDDYQKKLVDDNRKIIQTNLNQFDDEMKKQIQKYQQDIKNRLFDTDIITERKDDPYGRKPDDKNQKQLKNKFKHLGFEKRKINEVKAELWLLHMEGVDIDDFSESLKTDKTRTENKKKLIDNKGRAAQNFKHEKFI